MTTHRTIRRDPVVRVAATIRRRLDDRPTMPRSVLVRSLPTRDRRHADEALRLLQDAGEITTSPIVVGQCITRVEVDTDA